MVVNNGQHLVSLGDNVEAWKYDKYCVVFEDGENLGGFPQDGKEDWELMERAILFYHKHISPERVKH